MATLPSTGSIVPSSLNLPSSSDTNIVSGTSAAHPTIPLPSAPSSTTGDSSMASRTTGNPPTDSQSSSPTTANSLSSPPTSVQLSSSSSFLITSSPSTEASSTNTGSLRITSAPSTTTSSSSTTTTTSNSSTSTTSSSTTTTSSDTSTSTTTTSSTTDTSTSTSTTDSSTSTTSSQPPVTVTCERYLCGTTLQSTVFVTTTNGAGQTITSAPPFVTETLTKTNGDGSPNVITIVAGNPTPISNNTNATQTSQFFRNKGAVAGVFLIVGLSAASIALFIFFYVRRRRRTQRLEHDAAVASTLAAAGFNRRPLDDDEEKAASPRRSSAPSATMSTLPNSSSSSGALNLAMPTGARPPTADSAAVPSAPSPGPDFDPYAVLGTPPPAVFPSQARKDGYLPARTASPPPGAYDRTRRQTHSTSTSASWGHAAKGSVASTEPLLAGYYSGIVTEPSTPAMGPTLNLAGEGGRRESSASTSSVYSADESEVPEMRPKLEVRNNTPSMRAPSMRLGGLSRESSKRG
ncbi:hypothetical protein LXA43DRAFT_877494 [Ganoderma leucocontextum]|nr:hypothetical protein LXA43DRAFT_877494 [Ganoderma leucocontextum]